LKDQDDRNIILRWKWVKRTGGDWNWFRIFPSAWLWY